jgi:hypothetical protein
MLWLRGIQFTRKKCAQLMGLSSDFTGTDAEDFFCLRFDHG